MPYSDEKHNEIISNITTLHETIEVTNKEIQTIRKGINNNLSEIKQQTTSISQYTDKKQAEEEEIESRKTEKAKKEASRYKRTKGRNLDTFESSLSDKQIAILVQYCNEISVFNIDITPDEMKAMLLCTLKRPSQTTVNKYVALLFERLCEEELICKTWKSVAMNHKCFISPNKKELTAKDLSSATATASIIKPEIYDLIEECIEKIKDS